MLRNLEGNIMIGSEKSVGIWVWCVCVSVERHKRRDKANVANVNHFESR